MLRLLSDHDHICLLFKRLQSISGSFLATSGVKSVRNRNLLSLLSVAIWFISNLKMPPRRSNRRRVNAGPSKRRRIDGSPERVGLASTETAVTEDGHLHSENKGTSGNATRVSQPTIQSEPSIENFVDFEKILTASEVIQEINVASSSIQGQPTLNFMVIHIYIVFLL